MAAGFGIIGTGAVAHLHAQAVSALKGAELVGVYGNLPDSCRDFAARYGCRAYGSAEEMRDDPGVEFVCICTPSGSHLEPALMMAEGKKNLIIEKPLEVTPERCDRIIEACDREGVLLSGVFQTRFHPVLGELKKALEKGLFGTVSLCSGYVKWFREQEYYDASDWRGTWALDGGGALMNQSIHVVDLLLWLMGPVKELKAFGGTLSHRNIEVEDTLTGILRFDNGALGTIESTTGAWPGSFKKVEICGDRGHVIIEENRIVRWEFADRTPEPESPEEGDEGGGVKDPMDIGYAAHMKQIEDCIRAAGEGREPEVGGREAKRAVQLVMDLYRAAGLRP